MSSFFMYNVVFIYFCLIFVSFTLCAHYCISKIVCRNSLVLDESILSQNNSYLFHPGTLRYWQSRINLIKFQGLSRFKSEPELLRFPTTYWLYLSQTKMGSQVNHLWTPISTSSHSKTVKVFFILSASLVLSLEWENT